MGSILPWQPRHAPLACAAYLSALQLLVSLVGGSSTLTLGGGGGISVQSSRFWTNLPRRAGLVSLNFANADRNVPCDRMPRRGLSPSGTHAPSGVAGGGMS